MLIHTYIQQAFVMRHSPQAQSAYCVLSDFLENQANTEKNVVQDLFKGVSKGARCNGGMLAKRDLEHAGTQKPGA